MQVYIYNIYIVLNDVSAIYLHSIKLSSPIFECTKLSNIPIFLRVHGQWYWIVDKVDLLI